MCTTRLGIAGSRTDSRRYVGLWVGMILKFILALIFHTLVIVAASAEVARKPTLSGTVTDAVSGQPLVGAVIYVPQLGTGIPTDADGRYSIALRPAATDSCAATWATTHRPPNSTSAPT